MLNRRPQIQFQFPICRDRGSAGFSVIPCRVLNGSTRDQHLCGSVSQPKTIQGVKPNTRIWFACSSSVKVINAIETHWCITWLCHRCSHAPALFSFLPVESFLCHSEAIRGTGISDEELQDSSYPSVWGWSSGPSEIHSSFSSTCSVFFKKKGGGGGLENLLQYEKKKKTTLTQQRCQNH